MPKWSHHAHSITSLGNWIHRQHLCRKERSPRMTILDMKQNNLVMRLQSRISGNVEYSLITIAVRSTQTRIGSTRKGPIYGSNWTVWPFSLGANKGVVVSWKGIDTQWNRVNYLLTPVVQSNKYYKSRAIGVTSEVGLTTDRDLAEYPCLWNTTSFYIRDTGSHVVRATIQYEWC